MKRSDFEKEYLELAKDYNILMSPIEKEFTLRHEYITYHILEYYAKFGDTKKSIKELERYFGKKYDEDV